MKLFHALYAIPITALLLVPYVLGHRDGVRDRALLGPAVETLPLSVTEEKIGPLFFYTVTEKGRTNNTIFVRTSSNGTLTLFRKD